jgi:transcriptional regulator GlxA family with amidase domain
MKILLQGVVLSVFTIFFFGKCSPPGSNDEEAAVVMPPDRTLQAAFVIVDGVYNSELVAPMDVLHHTVFHTTHGIEVFTVGPTRDPIKTFEGLTITPDYGFESDSIPAIDILIVPSAEFSMTSDLDNEQLISFVKVRGSSAKYIMSLCDGAFVLAKAGLLDGLECTTFPSDIEPFRKAFPELSVHEDVSFVHDGKAITSAGGAKSYDPAMYLVEILYGKDVATGIGGGLVIDWDVSTVRYKIY